MVDRRNVKWLSKFLAIGTIACAVAPVGFAQAGGGVPPIRVEAHEVLIPVDVFARPNAWRVPHLGITDFHLFEDGREQRIGKVTVERFYCMSFNDSLGTQEECALTPTGKWVFLTNRVRFIRGGGIYVIAYVPPPAAPGTCHQIKVKVDPRDVTGGKFVTAEEYVDTEGRRTNTEQVDRRDLTVYSRTEYCSTGHSSSDSLNGTKLSKEMESYAASAKAAQSGLSLQASSFYTQTGSSRVHVVLDFPGIGTKSGFPGLMISLLGMAYRKDESLATRFSDASYAGCVVVPDNFDPHTFLTQFCRELIPKHYETQFDLPPGDYDLRVAINYGGELRKAQVPVTVENYDGKCLAASGIALCKRFHEHREPQQTSVPTMPFDFVPLVSKGIEFTPTGDTRFKRGEPLIVYFEVYEPLLAGTEAARVQFQMRITDAKTGELKTDTGLRPADSFIRSGNPVIPIAERIAIEKLPSGIYRLEVQATDSVGNKTVWHAASFTVE